ncbi:MAG: hypothetical protein K1W40_11980 [Schaedlerella sp.]|jgi:hypothetical protein|uniref:hypothetical protein n=1 Tax=Schaedlerella sp. TaxID=2676057 RepID=UPI00260D9BD2|nr:hypothetical protein [uncultured Schaedlerella sp.]
MIEWLTRLFDNRTFMQINAVFGFLFLGYFLFFYFSKEGRDERGRGLVATASLISYVVLFFLLNIFAFLMPWAMDNIVRLANGIQTVYTLFLLTTDIALLILKKIR